MAEAPMFGPTVLYHLDGRQELVTDAEHYTALKADGWADSPGALGIVTTPSRMQRRALPQYAAPMPPVATSTPVEHTAWGHLVQGWEAKLAGLDAEVATLHAAIASEREARQAAEATLALVRERVTALEQWTVQHPPAAPAADDEPGGKHPPRAERKN